MNHFKHVLKSSSLQCFLGTLSNRTKMGTKSAIRQLVKTSTGKDWETLVDEVCTSLRSDQIVALPTDTIYGIAGLAQSSPAVAKIYKIKDRDAKKPIAICVGDLDDVYNWGKVTIDRKLLEELLPGPVTVVFERQPQLNPELNPNTELVGIRVPDYGFVRDVVRHCGQPMALTSANISSKPSTVAIQEFQELWPLLDVIVDGGVIGATEQERLGSTVVNLAQQGYFTIIRPGSAHKQTLDSLLKFGLKEKQT